VNIPLWYVNVIATIITVVMIKYIKIRFFDTSSKEMTIKENNAKIDIKIYVVYNNVSI
jgi:hypothetical protein